MSKPSLFTSKRACCVCDCEATGNQKQAVPGEPNIMAISVTIYRRGAGKGQSARAHRVRICEPCLIRAFAGTFFGPGREGSKLWAGLRSSISHSYESMLEEDDSPDIRFLRSPDLFAIPSLPFPTTKGVRD